MKTYLLILAIFTGPAIAAKSWVVGASRPFPFNTLQNAVNSISGLTDDLYIFLEEPDLIYDQPLSMTPSPSWNGFSVHVNGGKNLPQRVAYLGDEVHEMTPDGMQLDHVNLESPLGVEGRVEGITRYFYFKDHLGSTRAVVRDDHNVVEALMYHSYGAQGSPIVAPSPDELAREKFTGKELDRDGAAGGYPGVDLNYFGTRYFDPDIGLWISPDPMRQFASTYAYSPRPINGTDPDGLWWDDRDNKWCTDNGIDFEEGYIEGGYFYHSSDFYRNMSEPGLEAQVLPSQSLLSNVVRSEVKSGFSAWLSEILGIDVGPISAKFSRHTVLNAANEGRKTIGPIYKTTKEATAAAEKLGFRRINETVHSGEAVYKKGKIYITRDANGHNGGAWKMAKSISDLEQKQTRMGTYDVNLKPIGD